ncbi:MAG TPA: ATP-binding protein [Paracoccaceae bacterium]|nr:ATP-binding protein [Paracoccaceae bacterium]
MTGHTMISKVLDAVPLAVLWLEEIDRVVLANDAAEALFGEGIEGRLVTDMLRHPDFHGALGDALVRKQRLQLRLALTTKAGSAIYEVHITPTGHDNGSVVVFEDQTSIEQASAMRRDFVANVSHELRTPLTALVGFIETLRGAARDDPAARDRFLTIMERESGRMIRLVNDLLSLSRVEAEEHRRPSEAVEVLGLLRSVITTQRELAEAAGVQLVLQADEGALSVRGDPDQLMQVFLNLAENGVKYGGAGGELLLRVTRLEREPKLRGPAVMIEVIDKGEGIDPIHLPRLTERFYRVDSHRSREKGGTGLGLAIVKHIVNRHRGRLRIESEPGKGSNFKVILPSA